MKDSIIISPEEKTTKREESEIYSDYISCISPISGKEEEESQGRRGTDTGMHQQKKIDKENKRQD